MLELRRPLRWLGHLARLGRRPQPVGQRRERGQVDRLGLGPAPRRGGAPLPQFTHLPWRPVFAWIGALSLVAGITVGTYTFLDGDALRVQEVRVEGAQVARIGDITSAAALDGESMLLLNTSEAADRVARAVPAVREASVERAWPQGVVIRVVEHQGWGYWQGGGRRVVVDVDGRVIVEGRAPASDAFTLYEAGSDEGSGFEVTPDRDAVRLVARLDADGSFVRLRVTPERFEFSAERGLTIRLADGPDVVFGDSHDYEFKVAGWGALLDRIEAERLEVNEIDLRFGPQLVMR